MPEGWSDGYLDWPDMGRRVLVEVKGGSLIEGVVDYSDFFADGEGNESPLCYVTTQSGEIVNYGDWVRWRFVDMT